MMEWRLAQNEVIEYDGDLSTPPHLQIKKEKKSQKMIRNGQFRGDDDDDLDFKDYKISDNSAQSKTINSMELTAEEEAELGLVD